MQRLGAFEVLGPLGAGGMGEVFRARDTRLNREVALKLLPAAVAADADRLSRFTREAQLLAALNHPNIAQIHGLEEAPGEPGQPPTRALVLELVEGPTLAERIAGGPIALDEALTIARQVADAVDYAHEQGIIHRDLKPANIKLRPDGVVKVLDFGLAKALGATGTGSDANHDLTNSPTFTGGETAAGVILGTAAYMSPEQARGRVVDRRVDVWAFGVVLFEMLARRRPFAGATISDTIAAILKDEPDWTKLPETTPAALRRVIARMLEKDPRKRLRDIGDVRILLDEATASVDPAPAGAPPTVRRHRTPLWLVAAMTLAAAATLASLWSGRWRGGDVPAATLTRLTIETPASLTLAEGSGPLISPDGRSVVVVGRERRLWLRRMDSVAFDVLPGTEGASSAFWSPDSGTIGFTAGRQVKIVTPAREVQTLSTLDGVAWSGAWSSRGVIVVSKGPNPHNTDGATLVTVTPSSGASVALTALDTARGDLAHGIPEFLPDGRRIAFAVVSKDPAKSGLYVAALDAPGMQQPFSVRTTGSVRFADGYAIVNRGGNVLAYRFDPERLDTPGEPTLLATDLLSAGESSEEFDRTFSVSRAGVVVYRAATHQTVQLAWVTRDGTLLGHVGGRLSAYNFVLSPDERRAAVEVHRPEDEGGLFILDLIRGTTVPFESRVSSPTWSPDASEIIFTRTVNPQRTGSKSPSRLFRKSTLHDGPAVPVMPPETHDGAQIWAKHWTGDGRTLVYLIQSEGRNLAFSLRLDGTSAPVALDLAGEVFDAFRVSPDGRLLAYLVVERGRDDVFVQPFAGPGERVRVTPDGGGQPHWRADGKELYYVTPTGTLMAVAIDSNGGLDPKPAQPLFEIPAPTAMWTQEYAPSRDGQRFLVMLRQQTGLSPLRAVSGWQPAGEVRAAP